MLYRIVLAAIFSLVRADDAPGEDARLEELARAIAGAVEQHDELAAWLPGTEAPLPFGGARAREAAAVALVAVAYGESRFAADVADCRRVGTDQPSITAWQLHGRWAFGHYNTYEICASPRLAAERALWVLSQHARRCSTAACIFRGYASGDTTIESAAARAHCRRWVRLGKAAGINIACNRRDAS